MADSASKSLAIPRARYGIVFEPTFCRWCLCCELVCSLFHESICSPSLSRMRIRLDSFQIDVQAELCQQCDDPACIKACPVEGAMKVDEVSGARVIKDENCISCGQCAQACPYNSSGAIIYYNANRGSYVKCDLCGGDPRCVDVCPTEALRYVQRS